ncbi:MAG: 16S rRNA (guanine(966)-N(2))-methyltransferase RsmD [Baekduia sp.]
MRVIAGTLGGRRFEAPRGQGTRPTPERVREALFSSLGDLSGSSVLDLYAGSGALSIEALSRGAETALLVERDRRAAAVIRDNITALGLAGRATLREGDALAVVAAIEPGRTFDVVLIDPPYDQAARLAPKLDEALPPLLAPGARVVVEADRRRPVDLPSLPVTFERRYGDTLLRIHTP